MSSQPHIMCMLEQCTRAQSSMSVLSLDCVTVGISAAHLSQAFESNAEKTNVDGSGARSKGPAPFFAI